MDLHALFAEQLKTASVIDMDRILEMRQSRQQNMTPEQFAEFMATDRLGTDELIGRKMLFFMIRRIRPGNNMSLEVIKIYDDEIDTLEGLKFERMSTALPIFEEVQ